MCTVSFFNTGTSLILTSNRDEKKDREKAIFPSILDLEDHTIYYPKDKKALGTWIVADTKGDIAILLNGAFQKHEVHPPYRKSRGIILLDLAKDKNIVNAFHKYPLLEIEPFQLLVYSQKELFRLIWDGEHKHIIPLPTHENYLLSSSTLYNDDIVIEREKAFKQLQRTEKITDRQILEFHKTHQIEEEPNIEKIIKEKFATVSITQLIVTEKNIELSYYDLAENKMQKEKIETRDFI